MGPKTKKMIRFAQSLEQKQQLGHDTPSITDNWMMALNDDGYGGEISELALKKNKKS